ncbi:hypothetical protein KSC_104920 [Ktedonobacter sp. SOSP1-52]|uniref:hypothetical protein n=1 Tax=Ktedonobacter sp. SOSP1-52 TaxID=2778366 RepID=UPI001915A865|nr:hypothetical protein [Ktedonobacter sp. SOSP1-52]GHO71600.1 hypothetical protein KSC_104920 [Ktedonobacter sp. SOSP1-52]
MTTQHNNSMRPLEKALIIFFGTLLLSLLIIFAVQPSIYTTTLWPPSAATERYPLPAILFLTALIVMIGVLMYGIVQHWRWLFWLMLVAFTGSLIQIPVEIAQLTGVLSSLYPVWYGLLRAGVGIIELSFVVWMIQTYRHHGVWGRGKEKKERHLESQEH